MKSTKITLILSCAVIFATSTSLEARWATAADAHTEFLKLNHQYLIRADGTSEHVCEQEYKILNENSRENAAVKTLYYNKDASNLEVLDAKTIVSGREYPLDPSLFEDKPVASSVMGFDQTNQFLIAFPNATVGARLYLKHKVSVVKPNKLGLFEAHLVYNDENIRSSVTVFKSAKPLYIRYNDPQRYLDIKQHREGKYYTISLKLKRPIYINVADEHNGLLAPDMYPWIFVTTSDNWQEFNAGIAEPFMAVMHEPLPKLYKSIATAANATSTQVAKINTVVSMLNDNIKYLGDWQTDSGRLNPKSLELVARHRLGDCKDFATGAAAILNSIGIKATVALVLRGEGIYDLSYLQLPGYSHFNHAIVKVDLPDRVLWVDPTNFVTLADKILPDIANREALVLQAQDTHLEKIPSIVPEDAIITTSKTIDLRDPSVAVIKGSSVYSGLTAMYYTGAELGVSVDTIKHHILKNQGSVYNMIDPQVIIPSLKSRLVADLTFEYLYKEKNKAYNTNAGYAIPFVGVETDNYVMQDQVSDIYLGTPRILREITVLNNINPANTLPISCELQSPWFEAKRTVIYDQHSVTVNQEFKIKQSWISNKVVQSPEFKRVVDELTKNFKGNFLIVFTGLV